VNGVAVLVEASRAATLSATTPGVLADAGVENVSAVARTQAPVAPSPLTEQRHDSATTRRVLCRGAQPGASTLGVSRTDNMVRFERASAPVGVILPADKVWRSTPEDSS
jgi:hypothetical protein